LTIKLKKKAVDFSDEKGSGGQELNDYSSSEKSNEKAKKKLATKKKSEKEENPEIESSQMESKSKYYIFRRKK
jgi:hypothetical protein